MTQRAYMDARGIRWSNFGMDTNNRTFHNDRAGWRVRDFCAATSLARSTFYALPAEQRPRTIHIGKRRVVVEPPSAWLARVGRPVL